MQTIEWLKVAPYVAYLLGASAGVVVPYLRKYFEEGVAFSWKAVGGKIAAAMLGLLLMPTIGQVFEQLAGLAWVVAFGMGLAATTVGHEAQKTPAAVRSRRR